MKFNLTVKKWNLVAKSGLPQDGTWCFYIWKTHEGKYDWAIGGYNACEKMFYVDFGLGGLVMEAENVVAWATVFKDETFTVVQ